MDKSGETILRLRSEVAALRKASGDLEAYVESLKKDIVAERKNCKDVVAFHHNVEKCCDDEIKRLIILVDDRKDFIRYVLGTAVAILHSADSDSAMKKHLPELIEKANGKLKTEVTENVRHEKCGG